MNPIIVNCIDIAGPADVEPLLAMAARSSNDPFDKCYILAMSPDLVIEMGEEDNAPIRNKLINRLNLAFIGIVTYCNQFKRYQVYQVSTEAVNLCEVDFDPKEIAAIDLQRLLNKYSSESFLRGGKLYHFATPSHNHTDAFFRLGDSIKNKDDLDRVAFWLLKSIDHSDYIFIDSWSIAALPLRAMQMLSKTTVFDALPAHPAKKYVDCRSVICATTPALKAATNPLLIVSVDSSGSLINAFKDIFSSVYQSKKISVVAVYSFNGGDHSMCKIDSKVQRFNFDACKLCEEGSRAVEIHPSAYYVKDLTDSGVTLSQNIAQMGGDFFKRYHDHLSDMILFHKGDHFKGNTHYAYYIDYNKISETDIFSQALIGKFTSILTPDSLVLSLCDDVKLNAIVKSIGATYHHLLAVENVRDGEIINAFAKADKVVVYDSVVISGKTFERLNNLIRETPAINKEVRDITFICGLYRPISEKSENKLRSCVAYKEPPVNRSLQYVEKIVIPDYNQFDCPWCLEFNSINGSIKAGFKKAGRFYDRLSKLSNVKDGLSGSDAMFHIDSSTEGLVLGGGSYLAPAQTSISGVVLAVASSLQQMRTAEDEKLRLSPGFPYTQVLGSNNFRNYSEGLLRSALIRNASAIEFGVLEKEQTLMVLLPALDDPQQGSLLSEYLIAVICGKLPPFTSLSAAINARLDILRAQSPKLMALTSV
ncbi:hypothetical protein [Pseudomonas serboccidentalis]|uniref:hypothetical protein n=1 Tax=Pseudomonas serboccidentalis TaxID=2964670 RepID=UPI0039DFD173